ncbi:MAG TPA: hypothetical protein P5235_04925 [Saprospiraceae bacterium]|nr:hypothetical protein [Saprospiraceae bacterium]MCB9329054.1 hypothetical protein [Lewinellaceae bacterium]HPK09337.1 hypothetical protein [Saprospiraceae bacterium]HRX28705.1 hypothetical protein [Saprospiraceae bacterium]
MRLVILLFNLALCFFSHFFISQSLGQSLTSATGDSIIFEGKFLDAKRELLIGRADKAVEILENLYDTHRDDAGLSFELAKAYTILGDQLKMEKYILNALKVDPTSEWINLYYGNMLVNQGHFDDAVNVFKKLSTLKPQNQDYYEMWLTAAENDKNETEALLAFDAMEKTFGTNIYTLNRKLQHFEDNNQPVLAREVLVRLTQMYPDNKRFLKLLALNFASSGNQSQADDTFKKILIIDPNDADANLALLSNENDPKEENLYLRSLTPVIEKSDIGLDAKIKELIPYTLKLQDNPSDEELRKSLLLLSNKLASTHPNDAKAHAYYGDVLYIAGQYDQAKTQYEKTLASTKNIFEVWLQYYRTLEALNDTKTLEKWASEGIDYFPNHSAGYTYLAYCKILSDDFKSGESYLNDAMLISGGNPIAVSDVKAVESEFYLKKGDLDKSLETIKTAIDLDAHNPWAWRIMGRIYTAKNKPEEALNAYRMSNKLGDYTEETKAALAIQ